MKLTRISTFQPPHLVVEQRYIIAITTGKIQAIELRLLAASGATARIVVCSRGTVITPGRLPLPTSALASLTNLRQEHIKR